MEVVVAPVDQNNVPVKLLAVNIELPQLSATDTVGAEGIATGAAFPLPEGLRHPFTCCLTVRVPAVKTVIDCVDSPVLQIKVPVYPPAVNTELPQLFATPTEGAGGIEGVWVITPETELQASIVQASPSLVVPVVNTNVKHEVAGDVVFLGTTSHA